MDSHFSMELSWHTFCFILSIKKKGVNFMEELDAKKLLLEVVKSETIPAVGCTEPVAVALAASTANKYVEGKINSVHISVSNNIYKNGKSVIIPNTNECGLELAAILGIIAGNPDNSMYIFKDIKEEHIKKAKEIIDEGKVFLNAVEGVQDVYVQIFIESEGKKVKLILSDSHSNISLIEVNGKIIFKNELNNKLNRSDFLNKLTFKQLRIISEEIPIEELEFIKDGINMNKNAAEEGLKQNKGLGLGASLLKLQHEKKISQDVSARVRILTAAAADFRMGGGNCPIMTSGGSGNQGLGVILPIDIVGEYLDLHMEKIIRAIFFGHAINNFVKAYTGKLSAICGCAIASGIGATAGIAWLLGGNDEQIAGAVNNMLANLTGMICDGAKETCALKLSTSGAEAVISAYLAVNGVIVAKNKGIVGETVEETIRNVGRVCKKGLYKVDEVMLDII